MAQSRAEKSILNSIVSLLFYFGNVGITIFARPIYLKYLGAEVQGMQSTLGTIFSTMSIAELGLGAAIAYALYKPLHDRDTQTINEIVSLQAWFYRRVALIVTCGVAILLCFFPYIFGVLKPMKAPLWYAFAAFGVGYINMIIGYTINYRSIIFSVDQRSYRLTMNIQGFYIARNIVQMLILIFVPDPFFYYLLIELVVSLIGVYILERMIHKDYPWLRPQPRQGRALLAKYPDIMKRTKQIFAHKVAEIALVNITPLVLFAYASYETITAYGNYIILYSNLGVIVNSMLNTVSAGIGSLVAEGNRDKVMRFFWEFVSMKNFFATLLAFALYTFASHLIPLWLGPNPEYLLAQGIVFWITFNGYISVSRGPLEMYLSAKGMYSDVWAPVVETAINAVASIALGYFFGIAGAIAGVIIAQISIVYVWKSIFLFRQGFGLSPWLYWRRYIKYPIIALGSIWGANWLLVQSSIDFSTIPLFLLNGAWVGLCFVLALLLVYTAVSPEFRSLGLRLWELARPKILHTLSRLQSPR